MFEFTRADEELLTVRCALCGRTAYAHTAPLPNPRRVQCADGRASNLPLRAALLARRVLTEFKGATPPAGVQLSLLDLP